MSQKDYYAILGVAKDATQDQIKKAYRKMAQTYHPDVNKSPEAPQKMKAINEAYDVLGDQDKRAQYDRFGSQGPTFSGNPYGQGNPYQRSYGPGQQGSYSTFEDLMAEFIRQQNQQAGRRQTVYTRQTSFVGSIFRFMIGWFILQSILNFFSLFFRW